MLLEMFVKSRDDSLVPKLEYLFIQGHVGHPPPTSSTETSVSSGLGITTEGSGSGRTTEWRKVLDHVPVFLSLRRNLKQSMDYLVITPALVTE